jgi:hypothetical protein
MVCPGKVSDVGVMQRETRETLGYELSIQIPAGLWPRSDSTGVVPVRDTEDVEIPWIRLVMFVSSPRSSQVWP